jgi:hypothetical protein
VEPFITAGEVSIAKSARKTTRTVLAMPTLASTDESANLTTDIAKRAFEIYWERGCQDGHDIEDWLQAERELQERERSTAA